MYRDGVNICAVCEFWVKGKTQNLWEVQFASIFRRVWSERSVRCFVWI